MVSRPTPGYSGCEFSEIHLQRSGRDTGPGGVLLTKQQFNVENRESDQLCRVSGGKQPPNPSVPEFVWIGRFVGLLPAAQVRDPEFAVILTGLGEACQPASGDNMVRPRFR